MLLERLEFVVDRGWGKEESLMREFIVVVLCLLLMFVV